MQIKNIDNLKVSEIKALINQGAKFVVFPYTISILVATFKRNSDIHFIKPKENTIKYSFGYIFINLLLGWWGIPWGPIYTLGALFSHIGGGKDLTREVLGHLIQNDPEANTTSYAINNLNNTTQTNSTNNSQSAYNVPRN
jgi:hypothetical protein